MGLWDVTVELIECGAKAISKHKPVQNLVQRHNFHKVMDEVGD